MIDAVCQFREALAARGIIPPADIVADGEIHRCDVEGKGGKGDGSYLLYLDGIPAGGYENWRDGRGWQKWRADLGRALSHSEECEQQGKIQAAGLQREAEQIKRQAQARERAAAIWSEAQRVEEHPYLSRKGIQAHGARVSRGSLVLPLRDAAGTLQSLQFIGPDGDKKSLAGGSVRGGYFSIGEPNGALCIAEGFATGASIHEAIGEAVAVAFDAGNLLAVARGLRQKFPDLPLILCADDDCRTEGNPGKAKATEAARAVGGLLALPEFGAERPDGATDFNDLHRAQGLEAVRRCIENANPANPESNPNGEHVEAVVRFAHGNGEYRKDGTGVVFVGQDNEGKVLAPLIICSPLSVIAMTRDAKSGDWGRWLEWRDGDGVLHSWAMPMELLQGDGAEVRRELTRQGLHIAPSRKAHDLLTAYLQLCPIDARARCVARLGWHGPVYVTPAECIGEAGERVVFQNAHSLEPAFAIAGTVDGWRETVSALAAGNSRIVFALSVAFAGPLLGIAGEDSGGFHFRGGSSSGKTTALRMAASVYGNPSVYPRAWRATANGLEGLAALHNDGLLILDELSQVDPKEAGEAAYLLANGQGKARATRMGMARQSARWCLLFLSAGEESLSALMARANRRPNAGQEIRLADIESDAGASLGMFEELHGQDSPGALSLAMKDAAMRTHGAVGVEWLRRIVADRDRLADSIGDRIARFVTEAMPTEATGQVERVARRFALAAVGGEMATGYGLTGWPKGEAIRAAQACFGAWLESFGGKGNREDRAMLAQVSLFFEAHGSSRFEGMVADGRPSIPNRAGFFRLKGHGDNASREFLVLPEIYKTEVCKGYDAKTVTRVLLAHEWIVRGSDGGTTQKLRLPGVENPTRVYVFSGRMWEGDE